MSLHPVNVDLHDQRTLGQKTADEFTNAFGTCTYIIVWVMMNVIGVIYKWDPYNSSS